MEKPSYTAQFKNPVNDISVVRKTYDLDTLKRAIQKRGDTQKLADKLNINQSTLSRAVTESWILSFLQLRDKSKVHALATLKNEKTIKKFCNLYDVDKLSFKQLYKKVKSWRSKLENNPRILVTPKQHDLMIGSILGDASIRQRDKNCNFRVSHSRKQKKYLLWKFDILKEYCISKPKFYSKIINNRGLMTYELSTATHFAFNYYRNLFYLNNIKTITKKILNLLNPRSLAIWVCDDGSYSKSQGYIILCTNSFSQKEHVVMQSYFKETWNLNPTIGFRDKKYYYLRFKQNDSKRLINLIRPHIPNSMKYKIGEEDGR